MSEEKQNLQRQADRAKTRSSKSVVGYLVILFAAAFVLLLLSYFMQQRSNEEEIDGLKQSVSAMQSAQEVYEENTALREELSQLEEQLEEQKELNDQLQRDLEAVKQEVAAAEADASLTEKRFDALKHLNNIRSLYNKGKYQEARNYIGQYSGLEAQLEDISTNVLSEEDREIYDPLEAYRSIVDWLN